MKPAVADCAYLLWNTPPRDAEHGDPPLLKNLKPAARRPKRAPARHPLPARRTSPYALPPFAAIEPRHYKPALEAAFRAHSAEIKAITASTAKPKRCPREGRSALIFLLSPKPTSDPVWNELRACAALWHCPD